MLVCVNTCACCPCLVSGLTFSGRITCWAFGLFRLCVPMLTLPGGLSLAWRSLQHPPCLSPPLPAARRTAQTRFSLYGLFCAPACYRYLARRMRILQERPHAAGSQRGFKFCCLLPAGTCTIFLPYGCAGLAGAIENTPSAGILQGYAVTFSRRAHSCVGILFFTNSGLIIRSLPVIYAAFALFSGFWAGGGVLLRFWWHCRALFDGRSRLGLPRITSTAGRAL